MPTKAYIQTAERRGEDTLVTLVQYVYTGSFVDSLTVEVQHYRPTSDAQVLASITARGASEKARLQAAPIIDAIIPLLPTEFDTP